MRKTKLLLLLFVFSCSSSPIWEGRERFLSSVEEGNRTCIELAAPMINRGRVPEVRSLLFSRPAKRYFDKQLDPQQSSELLATIQKSLQANVEGPAERVVVDLGSPGFPEKLVEGQSYAFVIKDRELVFAETGNGWADDISSDLALAEKDNVYYAGQMQVKDGILVLDNQSLGFLPDRQALPQAKKFFEENFGLKVVIREDPLVEEKEALDAVRRLVGEEGFRIEPFGEAKRTFTIYKVLNADGEIVGIFKPQEAGVMNYFSMVDIITLRRTIEEGGKLKRDVATYELDQMFGFNLIAETKKASSDGIVGTQMKFLKGYETGRVVYKNDKERFKRVSVKKIQSMYLFDIIIGHQDRHADNLMINADGDLKLIDNDLVLHNVEKLRWHNYTDIKKYFPHAAGDIDPKVRETILSVSEVQITASLRANGLSDQAIHFAVNRFRYVRMSLEEGRSMRDIIQSFDHMASISCKTKMMDCVARMKKAILINAAFAAPVGWYYIYHNFIKEEGPE